MNNLMVHSHFYSSNELKKRRLSKDILISFPYFSLMFKLAKLQVQKRYRRTSLGPLWIVVTNLFFGLLVGLLYSSILNKPFVDFFLYVYVGYTIWVFLSDIFVSSFSLYQREFGLMNQRSFPISSYAIKFIFEKLIAFAHNIPVIFLVFTFHGFSLLAFIEFILAILILSMFAGFYAIAAGILGARFADLQQIAGNFIRIIFFLTPIIWSVDTISNNLRTAFVSYNPFYHMIELARSPLLMNEVNYTSLLVVIMIGFIFMIISSLLFKRYKHNLIYWLG